MQPEKLLSMEICDCIELLEAHGIRPTSNRILIMKALTAENSPLSMSELEDRILSIDKSNIFRTLMLFRENHLVHAIEGIDGGTKYEWCYSHHTEEDDDEHVHFFCEKCHKTYCLHELHVPEVDLPDGYVRQAVSFLVKGICPSCAREKF